MRLFPDGPVALFRSPVDVLRERRRVNAVGQVDVGIPRHGVSFSLAVEMRVAPRHRLHALQGCGYGGPPWTARSRLLLSNCCSMGADRLLWRTDGWSALMRRRVCGTRFL